MRERLAATVGSLKGYVTELRMIEAKRLVRETDLSNAELAERLGYRSLRTFYRAFKTRYSLTPAKMRKQARAERAGAPDPAAALENPGAEEAATATPAAGSGREADRPPELRPPEPRRPQRLTPRARVARARRRAAIGLLDAGGAGELRSRLRSRHPELEEAPAAPDPELAASAADFLDALPCHRRAWNAASRLRTLANGGAGAPADELTSVLAALCDDLDAVRWEITGAQTAAATAARSRGTGMNLEPPEVAARRAEA